MTLLALLAVYLIWGSTYLGLKLGLEGFPPFLLNGIRFLIAGGVMLAFLRWRGRLSATRAQVWNAARVGILLLVGGVGLVTLAEHLGVGSAVAATAVAIIPVWAALIAGMYGDWPRRLEWVGLAVGLAGVLVLAAEGDFRSSPVGMALVAVSPIIWAFGSVWSTKIDLPDPMSGAAVQLAAAGIAMTLLGIGMGERITSPTPVAWAALAYLAVFGSLVAFTAYIFLIHTVRPSLATSYAYVNPVVAVVLGLTIGRETITGAIFVALPLILVGVALVALTGRRGHDPETLDEPDMELAGEAA
jgi:drug/metabolite transporter (DMT)-like permease